MSEPQHSEQQERIKAAQQELLDKMETELSSEDLGPFAAISLGFLRTRQDLDANATFVAAAIQLHQPVKLWGRVYSVSDEDFRQFDPMKEQTMRLFGEMMMLQHGIAGVMPQSEHYMSEKEKKATRHMNATSIVIAVQQRVERILDGKPRA